MRTAVIGAGVVGASVAFHLAQQGVQAVLYDAGAPAGRASGRSGALVRMHHTFLPDSVLARASLDEFLDWRSIVGGESGFKKTGFLRIVSREHAEQLRRNVADLQGIGVKILVLDAREAAEIEPRFRFQDDELMAYEPDSGYADPHLMVQSYTSHPKVQTQFYRKVTKVSPVAGLWRVQTRGNAPQDFDTVVLASAFGTSELLARHNIALPLYRRSHAVAFVDNEENRVHPHVTCIDGPTGIYFRPEGQSLTLCGPDGLPAEEGETAIPASARDRALTSLSQRLPDSAAAAFHSGYVAEDAHTPDGHAAIGPVAKGLYVAAGFSGAGFKTSPAVGKLLAQWVVSGQGPRELAPYAPDRFSGGRLIEEYRY